jgi:arylformamidase
MTESAARIDLSAQIAGESWRANPERAYDLSLPLDFGGAQPIAFGAAGASAAALRSGSFIGDVRRGGSCNCATYSLTAHCNGTHTECVGHLTSEPISIRDICVRHFAAAVLVSATPVAAAASNESSDPQPRTHDLLITQQALQRAMGPHRLDDYNALIVRTQPNAPDKRFRNYDLQNAVPYFTAQAMQWIVAAHIDHLVVDLPSVDRMDDQGRLTAHRIFWGLPAGARTAAAASRAHATITELAYIDAAVPDGRYLLNLQVAPFVADAAPSRPVIFPVTRL